MIKFGLIILGWVTTFSVYAQTQSFVDSLQKQYHIPELAYAVVSSEKILELQVSGIRKYGVDLPARPDDKFRIGSNTKAITGFIAARLVKEGKIAWNTMFFELFPEMKAASNPAFYQLTLQQLLSFRTHIIPWTYTYDKPVVGQFKGPEEAQRYQFVAWALQQKPNESKDSINFSNPGYCAAALMLEKISGCTYKELVRQLGDTLGIRFYFGAPNVTDMTQPWGHDRNLKPEPPAKNQKLNWLLPAGNLSLSLPDYTKFIQLQLRGLAGKSTLFTKVEYQFLHFGLKRFSIGWFHNEDENGQLCSWHVGNPGTFLSKVFVYGHKDRAIIVFTNVQSPEADRGMDVLIDRLYEEYVK